MYIERLLKILGSKRDLVLHSEIHIIVRVSTTVNEGGFTIWQKS